MYCKFYKLNFLKIRSIEIVATLAKVLNSTMIDQFKEEIQRSIKYLFPSALFGKDAKPMMPEPEKIFPKTHQLEVDASGAPNHPLFFTTKPKFYSMLSVRIFTF